MPSSFDGDCSECPYSKLLKELDEVFPFISDDTATGDEQYRRSNSVLLEALSNDDVPASADVRRSSSCEPRTRTVRWRGHHLITNPDFPSYCFHPPTTPVSSFSSSQSSLDSDETEEFEPPSKSLRLRKSNGNGNGNTQKESPEANKKSVASFKRSLRLLGLSPTDLGLSNSPTRDENCSTNTPKRRCCAPRPRLFTRLTRKSVSLDDVRKATPRMLSDADAHRVVAKAVYEEWYFGKQSEILRRKREEEEEERRKADQKAQEKQELQRRSEEKFNEWLQRKLQQKKESKNKRASSAPSPQRSYQSRLAVTPDQAAEAYYKWLQEKKEQQKRQNKNGVITGNRTNSKRQPDPERRKEALKVYQHWKQEVDENRRKEQEEKRRKQEEEEMAKRKREQEKSEDARRSFQHWKSRKEQEIRQNMEKKKMKEEREKQRQQEKKWQRNELASKAFLAWLDAVDERSLRAAPMQRNCVDNNCRTSQTAF